MNPLEGDSGPTLEMELVAYERFGPVRFGATEDEVVTAMKQAGPHLRWSRVERSGLCSLTFHDLATRVELDEHGRCERVVVFDGGAAPVVDGDLRLTGGFEGVVDALRQRGFEIRPGPDHRPGTAVQMVCDALGLTVWRCDRRGDATGCITASRRDLYRQHLVAGPDRREAARPAGPRGGGASEPDACEAGSAPATREIEVVPYDRVGPVRFGATEDDIVEVMRQADPTATWSALVSGAYRYLYFDKLAMRVEYDEDDRCCHVELFFRDDEVVPVVDGDLRLTGGFEGVVDALRQRGFETRPGPDDVPDLMREHVCDALGLVVWRDDPWEIDSLGGVAALRLDVYRRGILAEQARREHARAVRPLEDGAGEPPASQAPGATHSRLAKREMELVPFERFGPVRFDATEEEVVAAMGEPDRASSANALRDLHYAGTGILIGFNGHGRCHLVRVTLEVVVPIVEGDLRLVGTFGNVVHALHERGFATRPGWGHRPGLVCRAFCDALGLLVEWHEASTEVEVFAFRRDSFREFARSGGPN